MRKNVFYSISLIALIAFGFLGCSEEENEKTNSENLLEKGLFVLCEGLDGMNNSSLNYFKSSSNEVIDLFNEVNGQSLGDLANDLIEKDDKLFIAMKNSACINVVNKSNGKLIKRIPIVDNSGRNRMPSRMCSSSNKVFLCCVDGSVVEINAKALNIERIALAGRNPEAICYLNNKLYVSNSGGLDWNTSIGYDRTVSVIDAYSMQEIKKIDVGLNPAFIKPLGENKVGVLIKGNYADIKGKFVIIDALTDEVEQEEEIAMSNFDVLDNSIIYTNFDWTTFLPSIKKWDFTSGETFFSSSEIVSSISSPYGVNVSKENNEVYITDAKDYASSGEVYVFDLNGNFKYSFSTGINPSIVISNK
ncbi:MAG: hypothetical protein LBM25_04560 [Bacteroidales bacterium]|jgi:outer membrane protein assembly factor BamB|nr:hypothetical protein [Bacteroidales bacterium]